MRNNGLLVLGTLALVGCRGEELTVGSAEASPATEDSGSSKEGPDDSGPRAFDAGAAADEAAPPGTAGLVPGGPTTWTGYLENYTLPSGSDVVTMTLNLSSDGTVTGQTYFGGLPLLSPPTDPNVGYPLLDAGGPFETVDPTDHFPFTIQQGHFDGMRLTFTLDQGEIWSQWCALQGEQCLSGDGAEGQSNGTCWIGEGEAGAAGTTIVDCAKLELCWQWDVCMCRDGGCEASSVGQMSFDLNLTGPKADGSVVGIFAPGTSNQGQTIGTHFLEGLVGP